MRLITTAACLSLIAIVYCETTNTENERYESLIANTKYVPNTLNHVIPGRYIIEFISQFEGSSLEFVNDIKTEWMKSEPNLAAHVRLSIAHDYNSSPSIFRGISIDLRQGDSTVENAFLREILQQHRVKHVYPVTEIPRPNIQYHRDFEDGPALPFTHPLAQIDRVQEKYKGEGILVGIIDSGIDYLHPAFGGGFGAGHTVRYGYDLVGDYFDSSDIDSIAQKDTPLDTCKNGNVFIGHGTHVAGIIAANDKLFNFTGVSPAVTLGAWRIFGCDGATSNDILIKALISAYEANCDIINLSLGSPSNWAEDPISIVTNRISNKGSIILAAAGNDGGEGAFYISSPSTGIDTISVASFDNMYVLQQMMQSEEGFQYAYVLSTTSGEIPSGKMVAYSTTDNKADACDGSVADQNIQGKIVLVQRGTCTFGTKAFSVQRQGGLGIVLYNNVQEDIVKPQALGVYIPFASISMESGTELRRTLSNYPDGLPVKFNTALTPQKLSSTETVSKFSSVGPLYDMSMKPNFGGIGGYIFSTLPLANGGYGVLSGTSMATPYLTGAFALYLQAHGKSKGITYIREHLQNYAKPAIHNDLMENPARQGAGLIQLYDTIFNAVHVSPGQISFNDTANIKSQVVRITNAGTEPVTYQLKHHPSAAIAPYNMTKQGFIPLEPPIYTTNNIVASIYASQRSMTLNAGDHLDITLEVTQITGTNPDQPFPIYGGYIEFVPDHGPQKSIFLPYVGVRGELKELPIFSTGFPKFVTRNSTQFFDRTTVDGRKMSGIVINRLDRANSYVTVAIRLLTGTSRFRTEVLNEAMQVIGVAYEDFFISRNTNSESNFVFTQNWNATMIPIGKNNLGDMVAVNDGFYYLRWKALKLLSDPHLPDSWESKVSPLILVYQPSS
ncbi:peptidase S8/S53 domain-containing protein [Pilobolus umbonatus]|nr:peptidase S8/S53 domain-containing protein [Pilobolus umbonatus]